MFITILVVYLSIAVRILKKAECNEPMYVNILAANCAAKIAVCMDARFLTVQTMLCNSIYFTASTDDVFLINASSVFAYGIVRECHFKLGHFTLRALR